MDVKRNVYYMQLFTFCFPLIINYFSINSKYFFNVMERKEKPNVTEKNILLKERFRVMFSNSLLLKYFM